MAVWAVATSAGVAAVLLASEPVFTALKLAGAAYLVLLGLQALRAAVFTRGSNGSAGDTLTRRGVGGWIALRQGLVSNLGNPKIAMFFTSLLPQFAPDGDTSFVSLLGLGVAFCGLTLVWLMMYAAFIAKAGDVLLAGP